MRFTILGVPMVVSYEASSAVDSLDPTATAKSLALRGSRLRASVSWAVTHLASR